MSKSLPLVGIACDVIANGLHQFHGAGEKYINAVAHGANAIPMLLPAFGEGTDITDLNTLYTVEDLVSQLDGLFLTGSPSNIQPHYFKGPVHEEGTLEDPQRDSLTLQLINECMRQGVPILEVCRGFQELNVERLTLKFMRSMATTTIAKIKQKAETVNMGQCTQ